MTTKKTERRDMFVTLHLESITGPEADAIADLLIGLARAAATETKRRARLTLAPPFAPEEVRRRATFTVEPEPCDCPRCTLEKAQTERTPAVVTSEPAPESRPIESRINVRPPSSQGPVS